MEWMKKGMSTTLDDVIKRNTGYSKVELDDMVNKDYQIASEYIDKFKELVNKAIDNKEPITIVGDYDCDGITSTSIMMLLIKAMGGEPTYRLPRRISEGFGISEKIVDEIGSGLVITVDNGISAVKPIQKAKDKGLTVIITDHHLLNDDGEVPNADVVINPTAIPRTASFATYCGAGVAYKIAQQILKPNHPMLPIMLSFAAIGTVADVVPLIGDNRKIVIEGLKSLVSKKGRTIGLWKLLEACGLDQVIKEKNIGFKIGPILNAPGRLEDDGATLAVECLLENKNIKAAEQKVTTLISLNDKRKELKEKYIAEIQEQIDDNCLYGENPLIVYQPNIPEGIVGLLAGYFAEENNVSCFIFTDAYEKGLIKGSGRSKNGLHLKDLLDRSEISRMLLKYGGHAGAAGVTLSKETFNGFHNKMIQITSEYELEDTDTSASIHYYDLEIESKDVPDYIEALKAYAPFGQGNPEVVFKINDVRIIPNSQEMLNGGHLKVKCDHFNGIGFSLGDQYVQLGKPIVMDVFGCLAENHFFNRFSNQVEMFDFVPSAQANTMTPLAQLLKDKANKRY